MPSREYIPRDIGDGELTLSEIEVLGENKDVKLSLQDFGKAIKRKYPAYNDLSDEELANAVIRKYPVYESWVKRELPV